MTLQSGETVGAADSLFLITKYLDKRGRYCFRMDEILDPETVSSVAVFGEMFSVESLGEKLHLRKEEPSALMQRVLLSCFYRDLSYTLCVLAALCVRPL